MNGLLYVLIFALLFFAELFYFHIADKFNIIDKPTSAVLHASICLEKVVALSFYWVYGHGLSFLDFLRRGFLWPLP